MAGLLDGMDDPGTMGLLSLGMGLMGSRGSFGQGLAQAGPQAMHAMQQVQQQRQQRAQQEQAMQAQALQMQMAQMQIAEAQRAAGDRTRQQQYLQGLPQQLALSSGGGPTNANAHKLADPMMRMMTEGVAAGALPLSALISSMQKDDTPIALGADGKLVTRTGRELASNPKAPEGTPLAKLLMEAEKLPAGSPLRRFYDQAIQKTTTHQPGTNVVVDAGPKAFWSDIGKNAADALFKDREGATAAAGVLQSVTQIKSAAKAGAYQGTGAELKLGAAKALGALGMPYDAATVANTEMFSAQANKFVLESIKQLGANPSNADREFIEKTVPRLQTDPAALPALLGFLEVKARQQIGAYNSKADAVGKSKNAGFLPYDLKVPEPERGVVNYVELK